MKKFLFPLAILILVTVQSNAQYNAYKDTTLLKALYNGEIQKQINAGAFIVYTSARSVEKYFSKRLSAKDTFGRGKDTIIISKAERASLLAQLKKYGDYIWPDHLFPNSKYAHPDSASYIVARSIAKNNLAYKELPYYYIFSKPMYIRNNIVALVAFGTWRGEDDGISHVAFYRLKNERWEFMAYLTGGEYQNRR